MTGTLRAATDGVRRPTGPIMKNLTAIIRPSKLAEVEQAIIDLGVSGMTVTEVKGVGRQRGQNEIYRGADYAIEFVPKVKIEVAVEADQVEPLIEAIQSAAHTGRVGDGKIFVSSLDAVVRIRTFELGVEAL
jgi:nitrogen regulatory protein P-II 2